MLSDYGDLTENVSLKNYNTYHLNSFSKYLIKPYSNASTLKLINYLQENHLSYYLLGNGSNVILPDTFFNGVIINLSNLKKIEINDDKVIVGSGVKLPYLNDYLLSYGYINFAWASLIPGNVGGSIHGNAGCYNHDMFENLISITAIKNNEIITLKRDEIEYSYRHTSLKEEIILDATFKLQKGDILETKKIITENTQKRMNSQPLNEYTAGSVFKNPLGYSAGQLIEAAGFKGYTIGGAKISEKHANFIVNYHNASSSDIISLINIVKKEIKRINNIDLELEQIIVKWS